jgi:hypothetical protein
MAVVKEGFPGSRFSPEESKIVDLAIIDMIDQVPFEEGGPRMLGSTHNKGALIINCYDSNAVAWLKKNVDGNKKVLGDVALKVMSANDLPKPCKVAFRTRDVYTKSPSVLLTRLERLNPGLKSRQWRVLQRAADDRCSRWIFEVEEEDVEDIRRANFGAFVGLDRGLFKILEEPKKKEAEGGEKGSSAMDPQPSTSGQHLDGASNISEFGDLDLSDGASDTTLQPSSPCSSAGIEEAMKILQEEDSMDCPSDLETPG